MKDNPLTIIAPFPTLSQIEAFADACILFARVSSILGSVYNRHLPSSAVHSCLETTYFLVIFLCHFLIVQLSNQITHPLKMLFIFTFTRWLESILHDIIRLVGSADLASLLPICALRSVYFTYVFTFPCQDLVDLFRDAVSTTCRSVFLPVLHSCP